MHKTELRIIKYAPKYRTELGYYVCDEWTSIADIGKVYDGKLFTASEYFEMEAKYVETLKILLQVCGISEMTIRYCGSFRGKWRGLPMGKHFMELPYPKTSEKSGNIRHFVLMDDVEQFRDDCPEDILDIPAIQISPDELDKKGIYWEPIPTFFFTNTRTFSLEDDFIASLKPGRICNLEEIELLTIFALRGDFYTDFCGPQDSYIQFGWDYYMHFGIDAECDLSRLKFPEGIYVESCPNSYLPYDDEDEE